MSLNIVQNGHLRVSLFHGTSTLFNDSIVSHGLGVRNIVEEMGIRKAAAALLEASKSCEQDDQWLMPIDACKRVAADPAGDQLVDGMAGMSFRYGGTYLSASSETAAVYALLPPGGEALREVLRLLRLVSSTKRELLAHPQFSPLIELASRPSKPLLIEAMQVPVDALRSELGGSTVEILESMQRATDDPDFYDFLVAGHNFELTRPIPSNHLSFHQVWKEIEVDESGASREVLRISPFLPT